MACIGRIDLKYKKKSKKSQASSFRFSRDTNQKAKGASHITSMKTFKLAHIYAEIILTEVKIIEKFTNAKG